MSCFGGGGFSVPRRRSNCSSTLIRVCSALPEDDSETETETESTIPDSSSVSYSDSFESEDPDRITAGVLSGSDQLDLASSNDSEDLKNFPSTPADTFSAPESILSTPEPLTPTGSTSPVIVAAT